MNANSQLLPGNLHDWLALFGRLHVVVIHFPIALLLVAAMGEVWSRIRRQTCAWTAPTLLFGAVGAVFSMGLGWMLVWFSGYPPSPTLTLHKIMGTATAIVAIASAVCCWKFSKAQRWWTTSLIILTAAMVGLTGHLGGTLVHGNLLSP